MWLACLTASSGEEVAEIGVANRLGQAQSAEKEARGRKKDDHQDR